MKIKILSAYIDIEGKVTALTKDRVYVHKLKLTNTQAVKIMKQLGKVAEIETDYWNIDSYNK